jgi:hypothetical protein
MKTGINAQGLYTKYSRSPIGHQNHATSKKLPGKKSEVFMFLNVFFFDFSIYRMPTRPLVYIDILLLLNLALWGSGFNLFIPGSVASDSPRHPSLNNKTSIITII